MIYPFTRLFLGPLITAFLKKTEGLENLPNAPFIAAANHSSFIDDFVFPYTIAVKTDRKFHIFVNSRFYNNPFFKTFLNHYQCIPVDVGKDSKEENGRKEKNENAFLAAISILKKGNMFMIFPEGGRSHDGKLKRAKTGVARVALSARVPVVPIGIKGSYEIMPKGAKFPKFRKAQIIVGKPLFFDSFYGKEKDFKSLEMVTRKIMKEIGKLIDQEYPY
jgi:1-acyl-sn-glycerol-3-phosphate acyltransferase